MIGVRDGYGQGAAIEALAGCIQKIAAYVAILSPAKGSVLGNPGGGFCSRCCWLRMIVWYLMPYVPEAIGMQSPMALLVCDMDRTVSEVSSWRPKKGSIQSSKVSAAGNFANIRI
jgi:hypothetical protein